MRRRTTLDDYGRRVLRVLEHVQGHLDDALTPADLARVASFSPFHFQRVFRGLVGETVMGHVRRLRLERAAARLKHTDESITQLAFGAGYETHEAFTRAFHKHFGCSPSEFRRRHRPIEYPPVPSAIHYRNGEALGAFRPLGADPPAFPVEVEARSPRRVAYVRHRGPYEGCGEAWGRLGEWAARNGRFGPAAETLGLIHDDPEITPAEHLRYDACLSVEEPFEPEDGVAAKEVRGGDYAVVRYRGPYDGLGPVYQQLIGSWLPRSGREPARAPCVEVYWNDPDSTPPEELETDLCLPLED